MKKFKSLSILFCFFPFTFLCADIIHVPSDTSTIQGGIFLASEGDTVLVDDGTYLENINFNGKAITVASMLLMDEETSHISNTIIDGSQPTSPDTGSVVSFISGEDTTSVLYGFKIMGGSGTLKIDPYLGRNVAYGGGIFINESGAKIERNIISDNHLNYSNGTSGGGICVLKTKSGTTDIIIRKNSILHNSIRSNFSMGGGIYIGWEEKPRLNYIIEYNDISFNVNENTDSWKAMGGGLALECILPSTGTKIVRNNLIKGNKLHCVNSFGGGVYIIDWDDLTPATTTVYDSTPNPIFYNNIICDNYSEAFGGGISVWRGDWYDNEPSPGEYIVRQPVIINNTIVNNRAQHGFGLFIMNYVPLVLNNIIYNKSIGGGGSEIYIGNIGGGGRWNNLYGNIELFYSDINDTARVDSAKGVFCYDPKFADTLTYQLADDSPCIGAGIGSIEIDAVQYFSPTTCYLGNTRPDPVGSHPDIGACESSLSQPTRLKRLSVNIARSFQLHQNYPNPFNPLTTISFTLPQTHFTTLKVLNILGQEIATVVSKKLDQGRHTYQFDGSHLASGIYYYQLVSGEYREVKKMILLK